MTSIADINRQAEQIRGIHLDMLKDFKMVSAGEDRYGRFAPFCPMLTRRMSGTESVLGMCYDERRAADAYAEDLDFDSICHECGESLKHCKHEVFRYNHAGDWR